MSALAHYRRLAYGFTRTSAAVDFYLGDFTEREHRKKAAEAAREVELLAMHADGVPVAFQAVRVETADWEGGPTFEWQVTVVSGVTGAGAPSDEEAA
jgi:hypothetical protein